MDYSLRQAAVHTGLRTRHLHRLLDAVPLPFRYVCGIRMYDQHAVQSWWRAYRTREFDRAANLGAYRRRAVDADGQQVCPGTSDDVKSRCGAALGRTAKGRQRRLCDACRLLLQSRRRKPLR